MRLQLLPQPLILHQQQLHLVGLLQTSRWQAVKCAVAGNFFWLTGLDIPVTEMSSRDQSHILHGVSEFVAASAESKCSGAAS